ncbi:hypothetical protein F5Y11DRAFT_366405 [Daldinia sp. FL1419]|nr:hypothetical protein F5Y11DRAFT_366405 [Daldinia sp. FL1419]
MLHREQHYPVTPRTPEKYNNMSRDELPSDTNPVDRFYTTPTVPLPGTLRKLPNGERGGILPSPVTPAGRAITLAVPDPPVRKPGDGLLFDDDTYAANLERVNNTPRLKTYKAVVTDRVRAEEFTPDTIGTGNPTKRVSAHGTIVEEFGPETDIYNNGPGGPSRRRALSPRALVRSNILDKVRTAPQTPTPTHNIPTNRKRPPEEPLTPSRTHKIHCARASASPRPRRVSFASPLVTAVHLISPRSSGTRMPTGKASETSKNPLLDPSPDLSTKEGRFAAFLQRERAYMRRYMGLDP